MPTDEYRIGATDIKGLAGGTFEMKSRVVGRRIRFRIKADEVEKPGALRTGSEAIGVCVECDHPDGLIPSFLKVFRQDVPERSERSYFLVDLGLARRHWMFRGMPYGVLPIREINGVRVLGHVAQQILDEHGCQALDLKTLLEQG